MITFVLTKINTSVNIYILLKAVRLFRIKDGPACDGSEETDGLDASSSDLRGAFPSGLLVVQDGHNSENGSSKAHNFKLVSWNSVLSRLNLLPE